MTYRVIDALAIAYIKDNKVLMKNGEPQINVLGEYQDMIRDSLINKTYENFDDGYYNLILGYKKTWIFRKIKSISVKIAYKVEKGE